MNSSSMENLFSNLGFDWKSMEINKFYDVSQQKFYIQSFDPEKNQNNWFLIKKIIRKKDSTCFKVKSKENTLECSRDHKIAVKTDPMQNKFFYIEVGLVGKKSKYYGKNSNSEEWTPISVEKQKYTIPILDVEVDQVKSYYSDDVLSHNTIYGNPETTPGGMAIRFYSSIREEVRRKEFIKEGSGVNEKTTGIISTVKCIKNKVGIPFKKIEMKVLFGKGIQVEEEIIDFAITTGVLERKGTWYYQGETRLAQGMEKLIGYLKENSEVFDQIKKITRDRLTPETALESVPVEETDNGKEIDED